MKSCKEYRKEGWAALKGKRGMAIVVLLLFTLLFACLASTVLGALLVGGAFILGLMFTYLSALRGNPIRIKNLFMVFEADNFPASIGFFLKTNLYVFLWSILGIIPGVIKKYSYALTGFILVDHSDMTAGEAITLSRKIMTGKRFKYFCLNLSFIGWYILSFMTFGILFLWVIPAQISAQAAFYESVKDDYDKE